MRSYETYSWQIKLASCPPPPSNWAGLAWLAGWLPGRLPNWLASWLAAGTAAACLAGCLAAWLLGSRAAWVPGWLAGGLTACSPGWMIRCLPGCLLDWMAGEMAGWLSADWLTGWLPDWLPADWLTDWLACWLAGCLCGFEVNRWSPGRPIRRPANPRPSDRSGGRLIGSAPDRLGSRSFGPAPVTIRIGRSADCSLRRTLNRSSCIFYVNSMTTNARKNKNSETPW